jgi:hypothetical protein
MNIRVNFKISIINNTPWVKTKYKPDVLAKITEVQTMNLRVNPKFSIINITKCVKTKYKLDVLAKTLRTCLAYIDSK